MDPGIRFTEHYVNFQPQVLDENAVDLDWDNALRATWRLLPTYIAAREYDAGQVVDSYTHQTSMVVHYPRMPTEGSTLAASASAFDPTIALAPPAPTSLRHTVGSHAQQQARPLPTPNLPQNGGAQAVVAGSSSSGPLLQYVHYTPEDGDRLARGVARSGSYATQTRRLAKVQRALDVAATEAGLAAPKLDFLKRRPRPNSAIGQQSSKSIVRRRQKEPRSQFTWIHYTLADGERLSDGVAPSGAAKTAERRKRQLGETLNAYRAATVSK